MSLAEALTSQFKFWKTALMIKTMHEFVRSIKHKGRSKLSTTEIRVVVATREQEYGEFVKAQIKKKQEQHHQILSCHPKQNVRVLFPTPYNMRVVL